MRVTHQNREGDNCKRHRIKSAKGGRSLLHCQTIVKQVIQYDGSNDDLDLRVDFMYANFISITKFLTSK